MAILKNILHPMVDIGDTTGYADMVRSGISPFTPDIAKLEKYQAQKLFICDEWMGDRCDHHMLADDVITKVVGFTKDKFNYLVYENKALPVVQQDGYRIKGEIVVIRPAVFLKLDKFKLNGVQYVRRRVTIIDPFRYEQQIDNGWVTEDGILLPDSITGKKRYLSPERVFLQSAWMYLPNPEFWEYILRRQPEKCHRVRTFEPKADKKWLEKYYKYQHLEDY